MIIFTPLSGAACSTSTTPLCYLLQVDDVKILLDCGSPDWCPENADPEAYPWEEYCSALRQHAPTIDLVLLSHGDLQHSGLYPYAYSRWGLKAPAYTTLPVQAMGRIAATEDVDGLRDEEDIGDDAERLAQDEDAMQEDQEGSSPEINAPKQKGRYIATSREVHDAFDSLNTLRYSQPTHLQGKCQGLTITPFNAGHTIGGTIWKIRSPSSGTIVYAVNLNHMRERHLDGTILLRQSAGSVFEPLARPDLLVTDADRADVVTSRRKDRDEALIDTVTATLSSRSSVLLPCDSSSRVLELLVLLDQQWNHHRLRYPICFMARTASEMLTFVRSMMEWLGGTISKEDVGEEGTGGRQEKKRRRHDEDADDDALGAFALRFKHLEFFPNPQSLISKYSSKEPKLILAVPASLSHGPSRSMFSEFAAIPDNVVLLTGRSEMGTLGRQLFDIWNDRQRPETKWDKGKIGSNVMMEGSLTLKLNSRVALQGAELDQYLDEQRAAREQEAAAHARQARQQLILEADEVESDSDSDDSDTDEEDEVRRALDGMDIDGGVGRKTKGTGDGDWGLDADEGTTKQMLSFDIYLKGNVSKANTFFKTTGNQTQRFRMFPYVEKRRRIDEYGETIDVGMWLRKGKVFDEEAETDEVKDARRKQAEDEAKEEVKEAPSKYVTTEVNVQLACRLLFVDMEGLNDGRAVKTIVPKISPRKMVIVHANKESTDSLVESCANIRAMTKDIWAPTFGDSVKIGQQTNSFSISISDELLKTMKLSSFEDNEVGFVTGRVVNHATSTIPTLEPVTVTPTAREDTSEIAKESTYRPRLGARAPIPLPNSTMVGELKLTSLKARLSTKGIQAELVGEGVLVCAIKLPDSDVGETVKVRKTARGKVELEGNVSGLYYVVRQEIYNLHALVAA